MKINFVILSLCYFITACSSTYVINSTSPSYETSVIEFNNLAKGEEAEIILNNGIVFTAIDVNLSADSLYWIAPGTKLKTSIVSSEVKKVFFSNSWLGGLMGAGIGFLSGATVGLL
ncbi:MAG TPA: hypothetical protein VI362_08325 [Ignavibacteriaceae bacterium]|nr:hypothetical protein [Ignavibacteriaceae bacterium]